MSLSRRLKAQGWDVAATRRETSNTLFARKLGVPLVTASLESQDALCSAMRGVDCVFMCAGHYPRYSLSRDQEVATAVRGIRAVLAAARDARVRRFVLTSSIATVGQSTADSVAPDEALPAQRALRGTYHAVKWAIESEVWAANAKGFETVAICPTGIVGEGDVKAGTGFLVVGLAHGRLPIYVDGPINIVDIERVAQAHEQAALHGRPGARYIVAGHQLTVRGLLVRIATHLGCPLDAHRVPLPVALIVSELDERWAARKRPPGRAMIPREFVDIVRWSVPVDDALARRELGLGTPDPLCETIERSVNWYRKHGYINKRATAPSTGV